MQMVTFSDRKQQTGQILNTEEVLSQFSYQGNMNLYAKCQDNPSINYYYVIVVDQLTDN